jgi:hypothetical protein
METPIADLLRGLKNYERTCYDTKDARERRRLERSYCVWERDHTRAIQQSFGERNGWTRSERAFTPDAIGRAHASWEGCCWRWMDHFICYRARVPGHRMGRNIGIVGQPYGRIDNHCDELEACAAQYGLRWHLPPVPYASFWYPGLTLFVVMTLPDIEVSWLPEQLVERESFRRLVSKPDLQSQAAARRRPT